MTTSGEAFFTTLFDPRPMRLCLSARVLEGDRRRAERRELALVTAEEMQRAVYERAYDFGSTKDLGNALAAFLASRVYRLTGSFSKRASGLLVPGGA